MSILMPLVLACGPATARADHPSVALGAGASSAMSTESAMTLGRGRWQLGVRSEYVRFREYSDARLRSLRRRDPEADLHSVESLLALSASLLYGVTDDLTVGLRLPYLRREGIREPGHHDDAATPAPHATLPHEVESEAGGVVDLGAIDGVGDLGLFGQWRVLERGPWHAALLAGLEVPTGSTSQRSSGGERLEVEFQPGSGSVDGLLGAAGTFAGALATVDASLLYTIAGDGARDTNLGDVFAFGLALSHRLGGHGTAHRHDAHDAPHAHGHLFLWDLFLELNGEWREREEVDGVRDDNSGGTVLWLSPGARVAIGGRISLGVSVGVPIAEALHGDQVRPSYRIITSIGGAF